MKRVISIMALAFLISACTAGSTTETTTPEPTAVSTTDAGLPKATAGVEPTYPAPLLAFEDIALTGTGNEVAKFKTPDGAAAIAVITHKGKGNFKVQSLDASGDTIAHLVDTVGDYDGTVLFDMSELHSMAEPHSAAFAVEAYGSWTITVKSVTSAPIWDMSAAALSGTGDNVYLLVPTASGHMLVDFTYTGDDKFIVNTYGKDGTSGLANETGDFKGQVWLPGDDAIVLKVDADSGSWTIDAHVGHG